MYLSILVLPFLGALTSGFFGRKIGVKGSHFITCTCVILSAILASVAFYEVGVSGSPVYVYLFNWISTDYLNIDWEFKFDQLTVYYLALYYSIEIGAVLVLIQLYNIFIKNIMFFVISLGSTLFKSKNLNCFKTKSTKMRFNFLSTGRTYSTMSNNDMYSEKNSPLADSNFLEWFVGFTDAEGNFTISRLLKKDKLTISSFTFIFKITLHKDDEKVLRIIQERLGIGGVRIYKDECIFTVTDKKGITLLISIFDKFNLNTSKYLDYLDFKEAFLFYFNRDNNLNPDSVKDIMFEFKNRMNTNRIIFDRPENSKIVITKSWLLGFIEGDGSFFLRRDNLTPMFSILNTAVQLPVMLKIKEFLENSLGFDMYSSYKIKNTATIAIATVKARTINSKSQVSITIQNINFLNNYFIPFFDNMEFLTKKAKDFNDFKIICKVIYEGGHRNEEVKALILKLSNTMNSFRLSTYNGEVKFLSTEEIEKLLYAAPTVSRLLDGRVIDINTKKILPKLICCVYEIRQEDGSIILANSLSEAAIIVGLYPDTLSKYLDIDGFNSNSSYRAPLKDRVGDQQETWKSGFVEIKKYYIKRVRVFAPNN